MITNLRSSLFSRILVSIMGNVRKTGGKYECLGWGGKGLSFAKPLACFILLLKRIQIHSHKYTTAVFKFIQHNKNNWIDGIDNRQNKDCDPNCEVTRCTDKMSSTRFPSSSNCCGHLGFRDKKKSQTSKIN